MKEQADDLMAVAAQATSRNAGASWSDLPVVRDGNLITSRKPDDIPKFNQAMIELFAAAPLAGRTR